MKPNITDELLAALDAMSDHPKLKLDERETVQAAAVQLRKARAVLASPLAYVKPKQLDILKRNGVASLDASETAVGLCVASIYG